MKANVNDTNKVSFQKLGNKWYVFSEMENNVIYSELPRGIDPRETKLELYHVIEDHLKNMREIQQMAS